MGFNRLGVNYRTASYCARCNLIQPIVRIRCEECNRQVRHRPQSKKHSGLFNNRVIYELPLMDTTIDTCSNNPLQT